ncbi:MAG TPA: hypothetical protein ENJ88_04120 [Phaeodactylibacter sp.]|nr:hypothetical protein [Phaeodactylibacter sp.]
MKNRDFYILPEDQLSDILKEMDVLFEEFEQMPPEQQTDLLIKAMLLLDEKDIVFSDEEQTEDWEEDAE